MGFFEVFANILSFFYSLIPSYGLAIILLTLATRVVLLPLSIKSTRSMREMQVIQPELKRLQKKYKGDRQKLNEEMMKLYKEHGVNPFGGCAPLLLQMPVFIALYQVIRQPLAYLSSTAALEIALRDDWLGVHRFLGIRLDCSAATAVGGDAPSTEGIPEALARVIPNEACGSGLLSASPYLLIILLMGASTYYQQRQMMATRGAPQDPQQRQMQTFAKIMPVILLVFGYSFPAGVTLYWLTTNLWTIVQQRIMLKAAPPVVRDEARKDAKDAKAPKAGGKSDGKAAKSTSDGKGSASAAKTAAKKNQARAGSSSPSERKGNSGKPTSTTGSPRKSSNKKKKR